LPPEHIKVAMWSKDCTALIREQIESQLAQQKELDHQPEDQNHQIDASN